MSGSKKVHKSPAQRDVWMLRRDTENELGLGAFCSLVVSVHAATASSRVCQPILRLTALGLVERKQSKAEGLMQCTLQLMEIFVNLSGSWIWSCAYLSVFVLAAASSGFFSAGSFLVPFFPSFSKVYLPLSGIKSRQLHPCHCSWAL